MRKVLVAGGAGFIGTHFTEYLLNEGFKVFAVDNFSTGKPENIKRFLGDPNYTFEEMDIVKGVPKGKFDFIVDLASPRKPTKIFIPTD